MLSFFHIILSSFIFLENYTTLFFVFQLIKVNNISFYSLIIIKPKIYITRVFS